MPTSNVFIHLTTEQNIKSEFKHYQIQLKCFDELHYNALLRFSRLLPNQSIFIIFLIVYLKFYF